MDIEEKEVSKRKENSKVKNGRFSLSSIAQELSWEGSEDVQCQLALTLKSPGKGQPSYSLPHSLRQASAI